ncbi:MAG: phosphoenolpyruvate synthase, partial [Desulfohalobiaceae bacterium]|nr:phosphoenolpyruvate synthase [Desulfohalobiaceae bacterium]
MNSSTYVRWLEELNMDDVQEVGGKNAALGTMIQELKEEGIRVPDGFATTSEAYWEVIRSNSLGDVFQNLFAEYASGKRSLTEVGKSVRNKILEAKWPQEIEAEIR